MRKLITINDYDKLQSQLFPGERLVVNIQQNRLEAIALQPFNELTFKGYLKAYANKEITFYATR